MSGLRRSPESSDAGLLLAEALERALSRDDQRNTLTAGALADLPELVKVARRVEASAQAVEPSDAFRLASRTRLMATMREPGTSSPSLPVAAMRHPAAASASRQPREPRREPRRLEFALPGWFARFAAAFSAVALAGAAAASASASALPGDPLYGIKQATEQVALVTAPDDTARQRVLVRQADARLDETSRLLEQGRAAEAGQDALRYGEAVERATQIAGASEPVDTSPERDDMRQETDRARLETDRVRLASLLAQAPAPARSGLQRALEATERGLVRSQRAAPAHVNAHAQQPGPAVAQQPSDIKPDATPISTPTHPTAPVTPGPAAGAETAKPGSAQPSADATQRPVSTASRADQSRHDAPAEAIDSDHPAGGPGDPVGPIGPAATVGSGEHPPVGPPDHSAVSAQDRPAVSPTERPASPVPAVDKPHAAPATPVRPARSGRP